MNCKFSDLLGSIIPEQMKTLAPGRLFAVRGGRFNTTDDFEKYKERKTNLLTSELKERLGVSFYYIGACLFIETALLLPDSCG